MLFLIKRNKKGEQKEKVCLDNKKPLERGALRYRTGLTTKTPYHKIEGEAENTKYQSR